jgi:hypothetical protein
VRAQTSQLSTVLVKQLSRFMEKEMEEVAESSKELESSSAAYDSLLRRVTQAKAKYADRSSLQLAAADPTIPRLEEEARSPSSPPPLSNLARLPASHPPHSCGTPKPASRNSQGRSRLASFSSNRPPASTSWSPSLHTCASRVRGRVPCMSD